jgi:DNA-binding IclR family transcriptional regulator
VSFDASVRGSAAPRSRRSTPPPVTRATTTATGAQTLDRGIQMLELLARPEHASGLTVTEVAERLGIGRTIVYRLLSTLESHGLVARTSEGRLVIGLGVARFSTALLPRLRTAALPSLRQLAETVGATAHLTIVDGDQAVAVAVVEPSWTSFHVAYRVGSRHELSRGAAGKAILRGRRGEYGAVATDGELQPGAHGVAAPLVGVAPIEGSVGVVSLNRLELAEVEPHVIAAARQIAAALR